MIGGGHFDDYFEQLYDKFTLGRLSEAKFERLAGKLDEWEYVELYGINGGDSDV